MMVRVFAYFRVLCALAIVPCSPLVACIDAQRASIQDWAITPILRIDGAREDWVATARVVVGPQGRIAVSQPQDKRVILYDSAGRRMGIAGRPGSGPGELEAIRGVGWVDDSTIWVFQNRMRLSRFRSDGRFIGQRTLSEPYLDPTGTRPRVSLAMRNVEVVYARARGGLLVSTSRAVGIPQSCRCLIHVSDSGQVLRTVSAPLDSRFSLYATGVLDGNSETAVPFAWETFEDISTSGDVVGHVFASRDDRENSRFHVLVVTASGDTTINRSYPAESVPIPRAEATRAADRTRAAVSLSASAFAELRSLVPANYAPYSGIVMGRDGTVWIRLREVNGRVQWLVLDNRGSVMGRITAPGNLTIFDAERHRVWALEMNRDDIPSVMVMSVTG
jgi:hypothetical protein